MASSEETLDDSSDVSSDTVEDSSSDHEHSTSSDSKGRRGGLMVSAPGSGSSGPGSSPGRRHCVLLLGKTLYSHSVSLHPGVQMGTGKLLGKPNKLRESDLRWTSTRPGEVEYTSSGFTLQKPG